MKTKTLLLLSSILFSAISLNAQNVQSDNFCTSGGSGAGSSVAPGESTYFGYRAGASTLRNTPLNTFIGHLSGNLNKAGSSNVYLGGYSGFSGSSTSYNTVIGTQAGQANNGENGHNVMVGFSAGAGNKRGDRNTFLGNQTGENNQGSNNIFIGNNAGMETEGSNHLYIDITATKEPLIYGNFKERKVGIGGFNAFPGSAGSADVSAYSLFVKGGILTEEVRVRLSSTWADYVFSPEYKLPTLSEVEKNIKENGTLINVPTAAQIATNGIELGEMAKIQQEKIEELTLYLIQQNKEIEILKSQVTALMNKK